MQIMIGKKDLNILESSRINNIPIFIFSGKDILSLHVLEYYRDLCIQHNCEAIHINTINDRIKEFQDYQYFNKSKLPDTKQKQLVNHESNKNQFTIIELMNENEILSHLFLMCIPKEKIESIAKRAGDWEKTKFNIKIDLIVDGESIDTRKFFQLFYEQAEQLIKNEAKKLLEIQGSDKLTDFQNRLIHLGEVIESFEKDFNWDVKNNPFEKYNQCLWTKQNFGSMGCDDYVYKTSCGESYDIDQTTKSAKYCLNCGKPIKIK